MADLRVECLSSRRHCVSMDHSSHPVLPVQCWPDMDAIPFTGRPESIVSLEACLPAELRGPGTTITRIADGLSGAGVYRVEAGGQAYVLKTAAEGEALAGWRRRIGIQQLAADAGLAPRIVHVDEGRRAVLSELVVDRSFFALYGNPATREAAISLLGQTVRRVHELPLPPDADPADPRAFLAATRAALGPGFAVPAFVGDAVGCVLAEVAPAGERALVLSHNDVHPSNFLYDGENLLLLDWDTAGPNDPLYDLAAISVFLRMDPGSCERLVAAHDGAPATALPARFTYLRRLVAVLCGTNFLNIARQGGHPGGTAPETLDAAPSLGDFYQRMRSGSLSIATAEGQWWFGLALVKEGVAP